jgi:hypothetical protein
MKTSALLNALLLPLATVWAAPSDDLRDLTANCLRFADDLIYSLNDTSAKVWSEPCHALPCLLLHVTTIADDDAGQNTSDLVQSIVYEVGASMANLGCDTSGRNVPRLNITNMTSSAAFDDTYFDVSLTAILRRTSSAN